jgi:hypothetical protein
MLDIGKRQAFLFRHSVAVLPNSISAVSSFTSLETTGIVRTIHSERQASDVRHRSGRHHRTWGPSPRHRLAQAWFLKLCGKRSSASHWAILLSMTRHAASIFHACWNSAAARRIKAVLYSRGGTPNRSRAGRSSISPPRAGACLDAPDLAAGAIFDRGPRIDPDQCRSAFPKLFLQ